MTAQCRIALTEKCNLKCDYCCMKSPEVLKTFKVIDDYRDLDEIKYDSVAITGGEPLLNINAVLDCAEYFKRCGKLVYLYTNGLLLTERLVPLLFGVIDGINVGLHKNLIETKPETLINIHQTIPLRFLIWEKLVTSEFLTFVKRHKIPYRAWVKDECDSNEDRFKIKE